ncbi:vgr related protein [Novosphingobium sp. G106]|uniref:vgr related protein n=1 Tax=Novosphingobium sp. G106 TaxID=2849500 RepID=UPI001C2DC2F1|nr:vgr related protein [Novosphingobium sp. G106]MBV1687224.1 vgr related protein [Novosphingobium sp. G106]
MTACPVGGERPLTAGERALVRSVFGDAIDCDRVRIKRRRWHPLQPARITMAPTGHLHFPPGSPAYCEDFGMAELGRQGLFVHEMTHVWQTQQRGKFYLPLMRHPFCRYDYVLEPGRPLDRYGIEQQAEIVRHAFLLEQGGAVAEAAPLASYRAIMPFKPQS